MDGRTHSEGPRLGTAAVAMAIGEATALDIIGEVERL